MRGTTRARPSARGRLRAATIIPLLGLALAQTALAPCALARSELRTVVGATGPGFPDPGGFGGDGGLARQARISHPTQVARIPGGGFLFTDSGNSRVRRVGPDGRIATVAGNGRQGDCGDGGPAVRACLNVPHGVVAGPQGSFYVADTFNHRVRRVGSDGLITTVAGTGIRARGCTAAAARAGGRRARRSTCPSRSTPIAAGS